VLNVVAKSPFAPIVAVFGIPSMVIVTISPLGGKTEPAAIMPARLIELVPNGIVCDVDSDPKTGVPLCTVRMNACGVLLTLFVAVKVT
jgi:hypothetical protein